MSILHALATFSSGSFTVTRKAVGSYDAAGKYAAGAPATYNTPMCIQPVQTERDIKALPDDMRAEDCRLVLTAFDLHVKDLVSYKGEDWTVFRAGDWSLRGNTWTRAWMTRNEVTVP